MQFSRLFVASLMALLSIVGASACNKGDSSAIRITGSDTMVDLAQAWQEEYKKDVKGVNLLVKGGGSGVGIKSLIDGKIQIAPSSRKMKPAEIEECKTKNNGTEPKEYQVGLDALAIYVHAENPMETISIPQLADVYGEAGKAQTWEDLGVKNAGCSDGKIIVVSRQNSSGTYEYFKEAVLGEKVNYREGMTSQSGSADIASLVGKTPCAIGYSGMGYKTETVKLLKVSKETGSEGVAPSIESATSGDYPIARPLFLYTLGEPTGEVKKFIDWCLSEKGQSVVERAGYVPLPKNDDAK